MEESGGEEGSVILRERVRDGVVVAQGRGKVVGVGGSAGRRSEGLLVGATPQPAHHTP